MARADSQPPTAYTVIHSYVVARHPGGMPALCRAANGDLLLAYATNWQPAA